MYHAVKSVSSNREKHRSDSERQHSPWTPGAHRGILFSFLLLLLGMQGQAQVFGPNPTFHGTTYTYEPEQSSSDESHGWEYYSAPGDINSPGGYSMNVSWPVDEFSVTGTNSFEGTALHGTFYGSASVETGFSATPAKVPLATLLYYPPTSLFGDSYAFSSVSSYATFTFNGTGDIETDFSGNAMPYAEHAVFIGGEHNGVPSSFSYDVTVNQTTGTSSTLTGFDSDYGSYTAHFDAVSGWAFDARLQPTLVSSLQSSSHTFTFQYGIIDPQSNLFTDTFTSEDPLALVTVTIAANMHAYASRPVASVKVVESANSAQFNGTYDAYLQLFDIPYQGGQYDLGNRGYDRVPPAANPVLFAGGILLVNGSQYAFQGGYNGSQLSAEDVYSNGSLGSLRLKREPGDPSVGVTLCYMNRSYAGVFDGITFTVEGTNTQMPIEVSTQQTITTGAPPAFWVNGALYTRSYGDANYYVSGPYNRAIVISQLNPTAIRLAGYDGINVFSGTYPVNVKGVFSVSYGNAGTLRKLAYPANTDGTPLLQALVKSASGPPPAVYYLPTRQIWRFLGTAALAGTAKHYYGNAESPSVAGIESTLLLEIPVGGGTVTLFDTTGSTSPVYGYYDARSHLFSSKNPANYRQLPLLPFAVDPLKYDSPWALKLPASLSHSDLRNIPQILYVDGKPWFLGYDDSITVTYFGPIEGQQLRLVAPVGGQSAVTVVDPTKGTNLFGGTFSNGLFDMTGSGAPQVFVGRDNQTFVPSGGEFANSGFDITGNYLTLGSWNPDVGVAGLTMQYTESFVLPGSGSPPPLGASRVSFTGSRRNTSWLWSHATQDGAPNGAIPMMFAAGADHSLSLFDKLASPPTATIILNPTGRSRFDKPIRIAPQGDLDMGKFMNGPGEPLVVP